MDTARLRETLQDTGLTQYESEAYVTLLELGSAAATEVADASDVPQARIYDVLRNLEGRGYVETYEADTLTARARDPQEVMDDLRAYADTVVDAVEEIQKRWTRPAIENHRVSVVKPLEAILDRAEEAIADAERELQVTMGLERFLRFRADLADAYDRGVVVKLTLAPTEDADPDPAELSLDLDGVATEVRYRRLPTPFVVVADRTQVRFAPEESIHPAHEYGVMVDDYSLSRMFVFFVQLAAWATWPTIHSAREAGYPATYTEIRECIAALEPHLRRERDVVLTVEGQERDGHTDVTVTGRVADVDWISNGGEYTPLERFTEEATILLETDGETLQVGGWGALVEDVEGTRFVIEAVE